MTRPLILLTNDDGIESPGLAASAAALEPLGELLIVAPRQQQSAMGRSMPVHYDGRLSEATISAGGQSWRAYAADASPAQAIQHAVLELADRLPSLAVSGINFGENVGTGITISGTVGAALEAAAHGIPSLAVSLQVDISLHFDFDDSVDFSVAKHFTRLFAQKYLSVEIPPDVDVLKIDIPSSATPYTAWRITRLERKPYWIPFPTRRETLNEAGRIGYGMTSRSETSGDDTDAATLLDGYVSVTPLSLDMTSRVERELLRRVLACDE